MFSCAQLIVELIDLGLNCLEDYPQASDLISVISRMIIPVLFVWLAGTLPLQAFRIAKNIAGPRDVLAFPSRWFL